MSVGFILLVHEHLNRVADLARHLVEQGSPIIMHIDQRTPDNEVDALKAKLRQHKNIRYVQRRKCEWGRYSIVSATLDAAQKMLSDFPTVSHVYLASGSCLPLRPVAELQQYLSKQPATDFIESVTTDEVVWTVGGLDWERFVLRFPFSWKRKRKLFDRSVAFQRKIGYSRRIPDGVEPHLGSQWWCLTRETLTAILEDSNRKTYDRYFSHVWIPDESYFQSLVRKHSTSIESRSLTLSNFDVQGKPHVFYDDHIRLLEKSGCFMARKIWPQANKLYDRFLQKPAVMAADREPSPQRIERIFSAANARRVDGRAGLKMQSSFPGYEPWALKKTADVYSVFEGFGDLFPNFDLWLEKRSGLRIHGHLFDKKKVQFSGGERLYNGGLSSSTRLRDCDPEAFLRNLIWNTKGEHQCFQFGPDDRQQITDFLTWDAHAHIYVITGAWAVSLYHSDLEFERIRRIAARLQATEAAHVERLQADETRAKVVVWSLAEFVENPMSNLQMIIDSLESAGQRKLSEAPQMADLDGFGRFVQRLKNEGMNPHSVGDYALDDAENLQRPSAVPYIVSR